MLSCPVTELAVNLIRCPSISPNDAGCQEIIIRRLQAIGFTIENMNFGDTKNFWAWRNNGKTLAFIGHTDVVPAGNISYWVTPPFKPIIRDGMIFGRGAADMKGSLAAMVVAVERFVVSKPNHQGRLAFLITSDEEASAKNGTVKVIDELIARHERLDYCLIGEPTSIKILGDVIKSGRRGSLTCNLIIHGIQGHIAYPNLADNPIHRSIPMLNELLLIKWDSGNDFFPPTNIQIANIQAGTGNNNMIPGDLFVQFNFRFNTEITDEMIKVRVISLLKKHRLRYSINWQLSGKPFFTKHDKLVNVVVNTILKFNKIKPQLSTTGGTSDGRFVAQIGAEVVEFGLKNTTIHKVNEYVHISDLQLLTVMYQNIIDQIMD